MKHLMSGVVQLLGSLFGVLVLAFTGYQTWMLLFEVSQNAIVATIGLILFEGGTIYWWSIFKSEAKGIMQMALSLLLFVFGLLLMVGSNGLHLGAIDPTFLGEKTPERLILVAAVISLVGKLLFPLLSPEMTQDIWRRALQGMLMVRALMKTEATIEEQSQRIANVLGADMARDVEMTLYTQYHIPHNLHRPALPSSVSVVEGEVARDRSGSRHGGEPARGGKTSKSKSVSDWWQSFLAFVGGNQSAAAPIPQAQRPKAGRVRIVNREDSSSRPRHEANHPGITRIRQRPDHPPRRAKSGVSVALNELLATTNMTPEEVRSHLQKHNLTTADKAYDVLHRFGAIPKAMTFQEFRPLFTELMTSQEQQEQTDGNGVEKDSPLA